MKLAKTLAQKRFLSPFWCTMKNGMIKPEPYTSEPYPITESELREREERERKAKEERLKAEFTAFVERMRKKSPNT